MGAWIEIRRGERGCPSRHWSHPTMGAWIEIVNKAFVLIFNQSHPTMGAWIEILINPDDLPPVFLSHPTMGAWIEIHMTTILLQL